MVNNKSFVASGASSSSSIKGAAEITHGNTNVVVEVVPIGAFKALSIDPIPGFASEIGRRSNVGGRDDT